MLSSSALENKNISKKQKQNKTETNKQTKILRLHKVYMYKVLEPEGRRLENCNRLLCFPLLNKVIVLLYCNLPKRVKTINYVNTKTIKIT